MKFWRLSLLSVFSFFAIGATVLFSSCEKDPCTQLKCKNGSACTEGFCRCPTGFEGAECEIKTMNRFIGTYIGYNHCDGNSPLLDTLDVYKVADPNVVGFVLRNNIGDRFQGTANGQAIDVADIEAENFKRKVHVEVDNNNISMFVERDYFSEDGVNKNVCLFTGARK